MTRLTGILISFSVLFSEHCPFPGIQSCLLCIYLVFSFIFSWIGEESRIGNSPGLTVRPRKNLTELFDSNLDLIHFFRYTRKDKQHEPGWERWSNDISKFLSHYKNTNNGLNFKKFHLSLLGPCAKEPFGYDSGMPCAYLKLNKIYNVTNVPYNNISDLPDDMPKSIKGRIEYAKDKNQVWIECRGKNSNDVDNIGRVSYYPSTQGFPNLYFPYLKQANYHSPLVAMQFENPKYNEIIKIHCRVWAKNIQYDRKLKLGFCDFRLLINDYNEIRVKNEMNNIVLYKV